MKPYKLPFSLPPALPMPFDADATIAPGLFAKPALPVARCEALARVWSKALRDGVAAAVTHDHALFERLPGRHDPESLNGIYTDSPLVSPWTPANLAHQLPPMGRLADLLARQRRLQRQLDLDQDSAGSSRMDAEDTKLAA